MTGDVVVSVVMPCLNEAAAVGICVENAGRALAAMGVVGEVVVVDADGSYDFSEIAAFVEPLASGRLDMVIGTRLRGRILPGAMSWSHRWIGNPILSGLLRLMFKARISDSQCGMQSFTREAYERMDPRTQGMEFATELVVNALREGLRLGEIPITYRPRIGESKLVGMRDAWLHMRFMLVSLGLIERR